MNIINYIPFGKENAIRRADLVIKTGMSDRKVREEIEKARRDGHIIINRQDGRGYYRTNDISEIKSQYWQDTARALSILARRKEMRRILKEAGYAV